MRDSGTVSKDLLRESSVVIFSGDSNEGVS